MGWTLHPETGEMTTTFLLEQEKQQKEAEERIHQIDLEIMKDAIKWRSIPAKVRNELERKYKL